MAAVGDFWHRVTNLLKAFNPPASTTITSASNGGRQPLRMGILGAAKIAPSAVILPARSHPDVVISAVAARSKARAEAFAKKHGIPNVLDDYSSLIASPEVDVVYNPLPNGLHHKWSLEAIKAGKHVLLEKPCASNADQAREIFDEARKANVLVLEAYHYRFHPAIHEFAHVLHSVMSPQNPMTEVDSTMCIPSGALAQDDIRYSWKLAGGSLMDTGGYAISSLLFTMRAAAGTWKRDKWEQGIQVREARPDLFVPSSKKLREQKAHLNAEGELAIDEAMTATLLVPTARSVSLPCTLTTSLSQSSFRIPGLGVKVPKLGLPTITATFKDGTTVKLCNYFQPTVSHPSALCLLSAIVNQLADSDTYKQAWHSIVATYRGITAADRKVKEGTKEIFKAYVPSASSGSEQMRNASKDGHWPQGTGEEWWTTYRWQLEAFVCAVDAVRAGTPAHEVARVDPIAAWRDDSTPRVPVWVNNEESIIFMQCVDAIYDRAGLGKRP